MLKGDFLTRNNLATSQHFTLKSDQNAEIKPSQSYATMVFPRHIVILWYGPLKSNWNTIKTPWTMENKVNYIQATNFINLFYTRWAERNSRNKTESRKMGLQFSAMYFDCFILGQNVKDARIF